MVLLVVSLLRGRITTALYASVFSSITLMYAMCDDAAYHFLSPFDGVAIVNSFVALIKGKLPERKDRPVDFSKSIVAENITFSYPGADKPALDRVSFHVRAGETIAIVGNNGSGKTTLSKILLGIYTPKSGSVKIGDVDIGEISSKSVGAGMSAVFQNFLKYKMSVEDNIKISDPGRQDPAALERSKRTNHVFPKTSNRKKKLLDLAKHSIYDIRCSKQKERTALDLLEKYEAVPKLMTVAGTGGLTAAQFMLYFSAAGTFSEGMIGLLAGAAALHKQSLDIFVVHEFLTVWMHFLWKRESPFPWKKTSSVRSGCKSFPSVILALRAIR